MLRISAGKYKGAKLQLPPELITRPSSSRLRQAVFNILSARINWHGITVCDAFAGSGAMGLEALSRGAGAVDFCEKSPETLKVLGNNIKHVLKENLFQVMLHKDFFKVPGKEFDLIFLDPPYNSDFAVKALELISSKKLLKPDGIIVLEQASGSDSMHSAFKMFEERVYGNCQVSFYHLL